MSPGMRAWWKTGWLGVATSLGGFLAGAAVMALVLQQIDRPRRSDQAVQPAVHQPRFAHFGAEPVSADARHVADWVADSGDSAGPFVIVDKKFARLYVFDADARLRGSAPVLLGAAHGDDSVPGIGSRPLEQVRP